MSYPEDLTYPEPRYHGDKGEVTAVFRRADTPPDLSSPGGSTSYLATNESTGGEFGLYKVDLAARAAGAKTHFHKAMSESFYILSGELELYNGEKWVTGRTGDFLYVPVGGLHAFRNTTDEPTSMLMLFSPGAPREEYFERVAEMSQRSSEELKRFRVRHDSYFVEDFESSAE
ncbi:Cupin 2 conserved barrel domain protein [Streptomyces davaonensis JCM 4913]|uniref:Cupin 2 conserved barrel domain protein n=1 Tax=Streptomyces davaonensis (strain DSM 101723 / JCM 4913 / KCC S-0913 / 768) TaxID=1214101 RepID=K4RDU3_STRDJ|nr:cupin domain-containing protein [Streptomyces davaonensis]CCK31878.1 Cupin 2 conserved barrel domain protein [Streptomyces davaonensis JCM 4913]